MGMGRNMVLSVRHWIRNLNLVICTDNKHQTYTLTPLANQLFVGESALDEYMDKIGTTWLLHWLSQSITAHRAEINTSRWFFNYFNGVRTNKEQLVKDIKISLGNHEKELNESTLNKDIDCFYQMYGSKQQASLSKVNEDSFTSPFIELGLLTQENAKEYRSELSLRNSLPVEIFAYGLIDYMQKKQKDSSGSALNNQKTFSFDSLLNDVGSPGRIFRLSTSGLSEKLDNLESLSCGEIAWTDTQGLRQVQHHYQDLHKVEPGLYLKNYYQEK